MTAGPFRDIRSARGAAALGAATAARDVGRGCVKAVGTGYVRFALAEPGLFRTAFVSQPFDVAQVFTGSPGVQVKLEDTIKGFKGLVNGDYDHLPEAAFYMVGSIEEAIEKAKRLAAEAA